MTTLCAALPVLLGLGTYDDFAGNLVDGVRASVRAPLGAVAVEAGLTLGTDTPTVDPLDFTLSAIAPERTFDWHHQLGSAEVLVSWGPFMASPVRPELVAGAELTLLAKGTVQGGTITQQSAQLSGRPQLGIAVAGRVVDRLFVRVALVDALALGAPAEPSLRLDLFVRPGGGR